MQGASPSTCPPVGSCLWLGCSLRICLPSFCLPDVSWSDATVDARAWILSMMARSFRWYISSKILASSYPLASL